MTIPITAPIALFVYNRLDHTQRTVDSLKKNMLAQESDLIIFSDASKSENQADKVREVRSYIHQILGFKSITIVEREFNYGLAKSIIDGVTTIINKYGRIIVLEDDIVTSPYFLKFMNEALSFYEDYDNVGSISGYCLPISIPDEYPFDVYLTHRHSSWGWATYKRVWNEVDWDVLDYQYFKNNKFARSEFNVAGSDMASMLDMQMSSAINSWSIRFDYSCFRRKLYSVAPVNGLVENIGFDGTGVHCGKEDRIFQGRIQYSDGMFIFPKNLNFDAKIVKITHQLFNISMKIRIKKFANQLIVKIKKW